jgi:hypothetical protein
MERLEMSKYNLNLRHPRVGGDDGSRDIIYPEFRLVRIIRAALMLMFFVGSTTQAALWHSDPLKAKLPELATIPEADWHWVGQHMALDGVPMSIKAFTYQGSVQYVVDFYRSHWKTLGHGVVHSSIQMGNKQVLGLSLDEYYYSVQTTVADGLINGQIMVTPLLSGVEPSTKTKMPIPNGHEVQSKVESLDQGVRNETLQVESDWGVQKIVGFYKRRLKQSGYQLIQNGQSNHQSSVLIWQDGKEMIQLTAKQMRSARRNFTLVLLHKTTR